MAKIGCFFIAIAPACNTLGRISLERCRQRDGKSRRMARSPQPSRLRIVGFLRQRQPTAVQAESGRCFFPLPAVHGCASRGRDNSSTQQDLITPGVPRRSIINKPAAFDFIHVLRVSKVWQWPSTKNARRRLQAATCLVRRMKPFLMRGASRPALHRCLVAAFWCVRSSHLPGTHWHHCC
jgi:hypothetical protein